MHKKIYFNNNIDNYASTLAVTTISKNGGTIYFQYVSENLQYSTVSESGPWISVSSFPITIVNTSLSNDILTVNFTTNITITDANAYFICGSSYITFDGLNNFINFTNTTNYLGLIQNGLSNDNVTMSQIGFHTITIKNIKSQIVANSTLGQFGSWMCQKLFGGGINGIPGFDPLTNLIQIDNCINSGPLNNAQCGSICGRGFCTTGTGIISNCINNGDINNDFSAGICGIRTGQSGGNVIITNCTNNGTISGLNASGICGQQAGQNGGFVTITNCINNGAINDSGGGICGPFAGFTNGTVTITNSTNTGIINGFSAGGICGPFAGFTNGTVTISKCYNTTNITGNYAGGIAGPFFAYNTNNLCSIIDCYNIGSIAGTTSGGICGPLVGYNNNVIYNPIVNITNCYTLGTIATTCGGILGGSESEVYLNTPTVILTNCYTSGTVSDAGSGLIANSLSIKASVQILNCYIANNNWSDLSANTLLTGTPLTNPGIGTIWTGLSTTNTPYLLSVYNNELYDPNSVSTSASSYNTNSGLQTSSTYAIINNVSNVTSNVAINSSNGIISYTNIVGAIKTNVVAYNPASLNNYFYGYNINSFTLTYAICFKEDTKILCLINNIETYLPIQNIKPGTLVKTYKENEEYAEVDCIGWFNLFNTGDEIRTLDCLYELNIEDYPCLTENLVLTGRHPILVDKIYSRETTNYKFVKEMLHDKYKLPCIANKKAKVYDKNGLFKIWTFCLKSNDDKKNFGIYANGLLVECTCKKYIKNIKIEFVK